MSKKPKQENVTTEGTENGTIPPATEPRKPKQQKVYGFDHGKRCPACAGTDTEARSTQGHVQYRHCRRIGCVHHHKNYPVIGKEI